VRGINEYFFTRLDLQHKFLERQSSRTSRARLTVKAISTAASERSDPARLQEISMAASRSVDV
jgi:hypothetical protein